MHGVAVTLTLCGFRRLTAGGIELVLTGVRDRDTFFLSDNHGLEGLDFQIRLLFFCLLHMLFLLIDEYFNASLSLLDIRE